MYFNTAFNHLTNSIIAMFIVRGLGSLISFIPLSAAVNTRNLVQSISLQVRRFRNLSGYIKVISGLAAISVMLGSSLSYAQEPSANITRTDWEMNRGGTWQSLEFQIPYHGDISAYIYADIPPIDDIAWGPAPNPETIGFAEPSQITGGCLSSVDYTYFQTVVSVPADTEVTQFSISFSGIDDGGRVSVFNSVYPEGLIVDGSYVYLGGTGTTNLAEYVSSGENRIVVTQVDDCAVENNLREANVVLNGVIIPSVPDAEAILLQAVTSSDVAANYAVLHTRIAGQAGEVIPAIEVLTSDSCTDGVLGGDPTVFGELLIGVNSDNVLVENNTFEEDKFDSNGDAFLESGIIGESNLLRYAAVRVKGSSGLTGELTDCIVAGTDNDSWVRATEITPNAPPTQGYIDSAANARWYKFAIQPGVRTTIDLSALPEDYDVAVFKDISQAFTELVGDEDVDGLNRLGAEFAPSAFSPSAFSPSAFSPSAFSPSAFSPSAFSPSAFSPSAFSPSAFSPSAFSPSAFSPSAFSPSAFSPSAFSPSAFSPSAFSPSAFSPSAFSDDNYASAQVRSLIAVSAQTGTVSEQLIADTWNNTGYFYVRVNGKNGVYNLENPFDLTVSQGSVECNDVSPIASGGVSAGNGGYRSIILWDSNQLFLAGNSADDIDALGNKLNELAVRPEVNGVVVNLQNFIHIQDLHAQAIENYACPYAANLTARAIKEVIDAYREAGNPLEYIVLAGSDREIPFFRYADQGLLGPEQNYEPPMADGTQSQSSLRLNYILGQDEYGSTTSLSLNDGQFPLADLAVGRLVETPVDMMTMINAYLSTGEGVIDTPASTLVTGYDFLEDTANSVHNELSLGTNTDILVARNDTLITDATVSPESVCTTDIADSSCSWTAEQLKTELLGEGEDIIFLAGHFSANSALAADYETSTLVTELASSEVDLTNSLVFSAGCHSGYNIVNADAVPGLTLQLDWTQAFAQKGATLIAGTGYQYGDTDFIEYSERLYLQFARELRSGSGPVSVGKALVKAKQQYLSTTPDIRGLHRKTLLISTLFGLPMLSVDLPGERIVTDQVSTITVADVEAGTPGAFLGLKTASLSVATENLTPHQVELTNVDIDSMVSPTVTSTYYSGPDGVVTNPAEPAIPLISMDVSVTGQSLRGVGFRSGNWSEQVVVPLTGSPATELRGVHTPFASLVNYPMRMATANFYGAIEQNGGTLLHVTPAQHRVDSIGDINATLRLFNSLDYQLYYSNNTQSYGENTPALASPPSMSGVLAVIDGQDVVFSVHVVGAPSAGIQSVWVTYTEGDATSGEWISLDMIQDTVDSTLWTARLVNGNADFSRLDFMIQAVNGVGLVNLDDNFGAYYQVSGSLSSVDLLSSQLTLSLPGGVSELPYGNTLEGLSASLIDENGMAVIDEPVLFSIGGTTRVTNTDASGVATVSLPLNVTSPAMYSLTASFAGNDMLQPASAEIGFTVTKADTELSLMTGSQVVGVESVESGVTAMLTDVNGTPLLQRTVYFTITGGPEGETTLQTITDNTGVASLGALVLPAQNYLITARFLGEIPTDDLPLLLDSTLYNASSASVNINLNSGANCPISSIKGKVAITGFCYLVHHVDGKVKITDGTLIVGGSTQVVDSEGVVTYDENGVLIDQKIDQLGEGSVFLFENASVKGKITENGPGDIIISGYVDGNLKEKDDGDIYVTESGVIQGNIKESENESGEGSVIMQGTVDGNIEERGIGDIEVSGTVTGNIEEKGDGDVIISGTVEGNAHEKNDGDLIVSGTVFGNAEEKDAGELIITSTGSVNYDQH